MKIEPYIFFDGRCEEALEFYKAAVGAEVTMLLHFKDNPEPSSEACQGGTSPGDKVMHASVKIGDSNVLCSDGHCQGKPMFQGFGLSLTAKDPADAERLFSALGKGGQVQMPLAKTFWSPAFGMVTDRFGVMWMIGVDH